MRQEAIHGEKDTGFEKIGVMGRFECGNCHYFSNNSCGQKDMLEYSKQPRTPDGRIKVAAADCCEYVWRVGRR